MRTTTCWRSSAARTLPASATVLVVTGKGMTTSKTGILRQAVPRWLNEPTFRSLVLAFDYAEPQHGGEGALYVLLKRVREKK